MNLPEINSNSMAPVFWLFCLSVLLVALTFLLGFLIIPVFVFPPASILCTLIAIYKYWKRSRKPSLLIALLISLPIPGAVAIYLFMMNIFSNSTWH